MYIIKGTCRYTKVYERFCQYMKGFVRKVLSLFTRATTKPHKPLGSICILSFLKVRANGP